MSKRFDYFIMFAEMRTGSNFLEANINEFDGLNCYGEAYNPHFVGYPNKEHLLGVTLAMRDANPLRLIEEMKSKTKGLAGFRFFHDHDARVTDHCLTDARCAKIILTRNPLESYVSWKIARATKQWKLTNDKQRRTAKIKFDKAEFETHLAVLQAFQMRLMNGLQTTGQTAFYIAYEDISNVEILNGMAQFLEVDSRIEQVSKSLKRQNPASLRDKVQNFDDMKAALGKVDHFNLTRTPNFEPRRGPVVPSYVAAAKAPLMYLPIKGGPEIQIGQWLAAVDGGDERHLLRGFTQNTLRQWKRENTGHRSFTVIRHPVVRAHAAFCDYILATGPGSYSEIRKILRKVYDLPIPQGAVDKKYDLSDHHAGFLAFLKFLKMNLRKQTSIRVDPVWASQAQVLQGFGQFALPDMVLREEQLQDGLDHLANQVGVKAAALPIQPDSYPFALSEIYDAKIEAATRDAYQRDYIMFGYKAWQ